MDAIVFIILHPVLKSGECSIYSPVLAGEYLIKRHV